MDVNYPTVNDQPQDAMSAPQQGRMSHTGNKAVQGAPTAVVNGPAEDKLKQAGSPVQGGGSPAPANFEHTAPTFYQEPDPEVGTQSRAPAGPTGMLGHNFVKVNRIYWLGWLANMFYWGALVFYVYTRIRYTLSGLGSKYEFYGIVLLVVECLGATTILQYGTNLLFRSVHEKYPRDPDNPSKPLTKLPYHIRVMVPCYKEDLDIVQRTITAAAAAELPRGCHRTIYLCDDGKDQEKRRWINSLGPDFVYVSGRQRPKGEMNGKSGNLNNVCSQLYPTGVPIPGTELICIFDADQIAKKHFFLAMVPLFDGGDDVAMVLSPQAFHNLNNHTDIFNHSNIHFWEYMQPGYESLGFISCTGTNFLVRARAFQDVGWSPTYTLTEDFALGMELKKNKWQCRYMCDYLAVGEAPHEIRNCFQQRSRWTKGHFQIIFNPKHCPLFQRKLSLPMRLLYCSGVWAYVVGAITTPTFILIPMITVWIGVFPIVISRHFALAATIYGVATNLLQYLVTKYSHTEALWFANLANNLLWWAYVKAAWRSLMARIFFCCSQITFKATAKGKGKLAVTAFGDLWLHCTVFIVLTATIAIGIWQLLDGAAVLSPLLISVLWAAYAAIPSFLLLLYSIFGPGLVMQYFCKFCFIGSWLCACGALGLLWAIKNYTSAEFSGGVAADKDSGVLFRYIHRLG
ncbi:hypothetical protein WJX73_000559 [Symbiochloris irregularis]|uniref:Cellulose synthase (UDP-forming) n=1 Tax=Symbiochloris irregularis TaxID=706552 RepID=A0AAW1PP38_9CHLO